MNRKAITTAAAIGATLLLACVVSAPASASIRRAAPGSSASATAHGPRHGKGRSSGGGERDVEGSIVLALTPPEESLPQTNKIVLSVPERFRDAGSSMPDCTPSTLHLKGPEGCPERSRIGEGTATGYTILGGDFVVEHLKVSVLNGPKGALLSWVEGRTPVEIEEVVEGVITKPRGYGEQMSFTIPNGLLEPLPGAPGWMQRLEARISAKSGWLRSTSCPPHPWSLKAELGYTDGQGIEIAARLKCA
jgi:hypothetical protein